MWQEVNDQLIVCHSPVSASAVKPVGEWTKVKGRWRGPGDNKRGDENLRPDLRHLFQSQC